MREVRARASPTVMEAFLAEYGLSTDEGVGLMCLAEALLRVPDAETIDELIADKIEPSNWGAHLGQSTSQPGQRRHLGPDADRPRARRRARAPRRARCAALVRRLGEPVVRTAVGQAMKLMGRQFVLGETIDAAMDRARALEAKGYTYSYDMLGEAARTDADAARYAARLRRRDRAPSPPAPPATCAPAPASRSSSRRCIRATSGRHRGEVMRELVPRALRTRPRRRRAPASASTSTPRRPTGSTSRST